jgi:hypothetical protein
MNEATIQIVHAIPGRIRVKVAHLRDTPALADQIREQLAAVPGVKKVETNARAASVLILYDEAVLGSPEGFQAFVAPLVALFPDVTPPDFDSWRSLSSGGGAASAAAPSVGEAIRSFFGEVNAKIDQATVSSIDLKVIVPLLLFGLGIRSLIKSEKLLSPAWYDFFWFALGTYFMLNPKPGEGQR